MENHNNLISNLQTSFGALWIIWWLGEDKKGPLMFMLMDIFLVFHDLWIFVILSWCTWYTQPSLPLMKNHRLRYHTRFSFPSLHISLQRLILIQQVGPLDSPPFLAWEHNMWGPCLSLSKIPKVIQVSPYGWPIGFVLHPPPT